MKKVILSIGVPGSGKTTLLKDFSYKHNYQYICPDDIRKEITGDVTDQSKNKEVWELAYERLAEALKDDKTVVFDATFTNLDLRVKLIDFAKQNGADKIHGVWLDTPILLARERNNNRERTVPAEVIERMHGQLEENIPDTEDGFDGVFRFNENCDLVEAKIKTENKTKDEGDTLHKEFHPPVR